MKLYFNPFLHRLLVLAIISVFQQSCTKPQYDCEFRCENEPVTLYALGFDRDELDTIFIDQYQVDGNFFTRTTMLYNSASPSSDTGLFKLDVSQWDLYKINFPAAGRKYELRGGANKGNFRVRAACGSNHQCVNEIDHFYLDSQKVAGNVATLKK